MLVITIPKQRLWDSKNELFINTKEYKLSLEHSLVSVSKWESKWHIPFIGEEKKTHEQTVDYIKCMTLTQNIDQTAYDMLTKSNFQEINDYIENKMTATWFGDSKTSRPGPIKREVITSELIYYWMIALEIPFECQKWHLNRLLTLVKVCNAKAKSTNKKKPAKEIMSRNAQLNAARRKKLGTSG